MKTSFGCQRIEYRVYEVCEAQEVVRDAELGAGDSDGEGRLFGDGLVQYS